MKHDTVASSLTEKWQGAGTPYRRSVVKPLTTMASSHSQRESVSGDSTDGAQYTDEHGRLEKDEIADALEKRGTALESGKYFPHGRGESINGGCQTLATALRDGSSSEIGVEAGRLLNTVTEGMGDIERIDLRHSTEVLEHLQHIQFAIVEALEHSDEQASSE